MKRVWLKKIVLLRSMSSAPPGNCAVKPKCYYYHKFSHFSYVQSKIIFINISFYFGVQLAKNVHVTKFYIKQCEEKIQDWKTVYSLENLKRWTKFVYREKYHYWGKKFRFVVIFVSIFKIPCFPMLLFTFKLYVRNK